jgi:hypothetical protein
MILGALLRAGLRATGETDTEPREMQEKKMHIPVSSGIRGNRGAIGGSGVNAFGEGGCYDCWKSRQFMASARIHGKRVSGSCPTKYVTGDPAGSGWHEGLFLPCRAWVWLSGERK